MTQFLAERISFIKGLIRENRLLEATTGAEQLLEEYKGSLKLLLLIASIEEKKNDILSAQQHYLAIMKAFPNAYQPVVALGRLAIKQQNFDELQDYFLKLSELNCPQDQIIQLKVVEAQQQKNVLAEIAALTQLLAVQAKPEQKNLIRLARLYLNSRQFELLSDLVDKSLTLYPESEQFLLFRLKLAEKDGDSQKAIMFCQQLINQEPNQIKWIVTYIKLLVHSGDLVQAENVFRATLDKGLACAPLCLLALEIVLPIDIKQKILNWAQLVDQTSSLVEQNAAVNIILNLRGDNTVGLLSGDILGSITEPMILQYHAPTDRELKRPLVEDHMEEVTVVKALNSNIVVIVFTGLANRTGMSIALLDRFFAKLNVSVIYLRDPTRLIFNNGLSSIGDDFFTSVRNLKSLIVDTHASKVVAFGNSAGGFAAIRYGLALDADLILGFGAATNLSAEFLKDDGRARIIVKRLQGLPADTLDVKPLIKASNGNIPIHLYYGEKMPQDRRHAQYVKDEVGVFLHELEGQASHNVLGCIAESGNLLKMLASHFDFK